MFRMTGTYDSPKASQYLQQLCKHFAHKTEVSFDARNGRVVLGLGTVTLGATADRLTASIQLADAGSADQARHVIDKHLAIFAHREGFQSMTWQEPAEE